MAEGGMPAAGQCVQAGYRSGALPRRVGATGKEEQALARKHWETHGWKAHRKGDG